VSLLWVPLSLGPILMEQLQCVGEGVGSDIVGTAGDHWHKCNFSWSIVISAIDYCGCHHCEYHGHGWARLSWSHCSW